MLWTITAFMHTYIAQPTIPAPRPLAAATATADAGEPCRGHGNDQSCQGDRLNPRRRSPTPQQRMTPGATGCATAPAILPRRMSKSPHCHADTVRRTCGPAGSSRGYGAGSARRTRAQRFPGPAICRAAAANVGCTGLGKRCRSRYLAAAGPDHRPGSLAAASSERAGARRHRHTVAAGPSERRSRTAEPDARRAAVRLRSRHRALTKLCWSMTFSENRYPLFGIMP